MNEMTQTIKEKSKNIGSLVGFLKKNLDFLNFIENSIPKEIQSRTLSEKVFYFLNEINEPLACKCGEHLQF
ncbi:hypothetical protein EBU94_08015, partial [bacterium]|nr:hypothetical protein [bacterium]